MSVEDRAMKLKDGQILYNDLRGKSETLIAPKFAQETANDPGSFVVYTDGKVYFLESGHTAGTSWENTTKAETNIGVQLGQLKSAIQEDEVKEKLLTGDIPGTTKTVTMDSDGNPVSIVHIANNEAVRTDSFVWGENTVTETRTLASGKYITIQTNLITLETVVSAVQEVA